MTTNSHLVNGIISISTSEGIKNRERIINTLKELYKNEGLQVEFDKKAAELTIGILSISFHAKTNIAFETIIENTLIHITEQTTNKLYSILKNTGWLMQIQCTEVIPNLKKISSHTFDFSHVKSKTLTSTVLQSHTTNEMPWTLTNYLNNTNENIEEVMNSTLCESFLKENKRLSEFTNDNDDEISNIISFIYKFAIDNYTNYQDAEYRLCKSKKFKSIYNEVIIDIMGDNNIPNLYQPSQFKKLQVFTEDGVAYTLDFLFGDKLEEMNFTEVNMQLENNNINKINVLSLMAYLNQSKETY